MHKQISLRLSAQLLSSAVRYAKRNGYGSIQELVREAVREKVHGEELLTKKEEQLVRRLVQEARSSGKWIEGAELRRRLSR